MALVFNYSKKSTTDPGLFQITVSANYGSPNPDRNQGGEVLIAAHTTQKEVEEFIPVDSSPYLTKSTYDIYNTLDGAYKVESLRFALYNAGTPYIPEIKDNNNIITTYASVIYYSPTDKFYKNISASTGIAPDAVNGTTYWQQITDFTTDEIRNNTNLIIGTYQFVHLDRSKLCVKNELFKLSSMCGCDDLKEYLPFLKKKVLLDGACALAADFKFSNAEANIRVLQKLCPTC